MKAREKSILGGESSMQRPCGSQQHSKDKGLKQGQCYLE